MAFIRRRVKFDLLRTCVISLRGYRKPSNNTSIESLDFNLRKVARASALFTKLYDWILLFIL